MTLDARIRRSMAHPARRACLRDAIGGGTPRAPRAVLGLSVLSFSGQRDLPEQIASIRSFLRHVGEPADWTIVSDGSHSSLARTVLGGLHRCVRLRRLDEIVRPDLPAEVVRYAAGDSMGKKLALELSLPVRRRTLYVDADVVFFAGARALPRLIASSDGRPWYLPDCGRYFDDRLLSRTEAAHPVNGGLFATSAPLDWRTALARLRDLNGRPHYHSEQTLLHLAMHRSEARPLPVDAFVLSRRDEHRATDAFAGRDVALRHYTTPVRPKLWPAVERGG
jgi:hypothetical protein